MSRRDRLISDVQRGFDALEAGEYDDAATCLARAERVDRHDPDVVALGAAVAEAGGDIDGAVAAYAELIELRPDEPRARIGLARLQLEAIGDADAALETIGAAFDFIDDDSDLIDAIIVRAAALVAIDDLEAAREVLGELASSPIDDPELALDVGDLALQAEDFAAAKRWAELARASEPHRADALHLLGSIADATGDAAARTATWREVLALDAAAPVGPVAISQDALEQIALAALAELPEDVRARLERVPILIDDLPSAELVAEGLDPRMLGVFQGASMREGSDLAATVTNIMLFRKNLERVSADLDDLAEQVRITVLHETAHYFGLEDEDLERLGLD